MPARRGGGCSTTNVRRRPETTSSSSTTFSERAFAGVTEASGRPPLSIRTKSLYGLGESVATTAQTAVDTFLLFYLTAVVGLSGTLAGAAMFVALLVDGVADPLIGYASDNTRSRYGRRHPFMLIV